MSIRLKLTLFAALISGSLLLVVGYFTLVIERKHTQEMTRERLELIDQSTQRAAKDSLIQKDHLMLLSDLKFLRSLFPALTYCEVEWVDGSRSNKYHSGAPAGGAHIRERTFVVSDPTDPRRQIRLSVGVDHSILDARAQEDMSRLERDLLRLFGLALIISLIFADWFSRRMTHPLQALSAGVAEIGRGKVGVHLDWSSADEIGTLVTGFNTMSQRLEELDAMKKDFVSSVTHELRSPLGAIDSFLGLMESKLAGGRPSDEAQFREYLSRIKANVRRLSGFISDLLDVAKLEKGKMECTLRPIKIQAIAEEVVQFFGPKSKEQGVELSSRIPPDLGDVQGDPERLRQVLVNLVANALKFTPRGGQIWAQAEQFREEGQKYVEISVFDSGRGMDVGDTARIFEKFSQGKNVHMGVAGPKGTGLGLYIVKSIVEAHGGKVSVKSAPGKGTQFIFNLRMV